MWQTTDIPNLLLHRNGYYYARFSIAGRRQMKALGTKKLAVARQKMREFMSQVERSRELVKANGILPEDVTMGDLADMFLRQTDEDSNLAASSQICRHTYVRRIRMTWADFDRLKPAAVKSDDVSEWVNRLHSSAEFPVSPNAKTVRCGYSASAVNHSLEVFVRLLNMAVAKGALMQNPLTPEAVKLMRRKTTPQPLSLPSKDQMLRALDAMAELKVEMPKRHSALLQRMAEQAVDAMDLAKLMAFSGTRLSEACSICWEHCHDSDNTITVNGTKTPAAQRIIPQIPAMRGLLTAIRARRLAQGMTVLSGPVVRVASCQKTLTRACAAAGVPRITHHRLRHFLLPGLSIPVSPHANSQTGSGTKTEA